MYRAPLVLILLCLMASSSLTLLQLATRERIAAGKAQLRYSAAAALLSRSTRPSGPLKNMVRKSLLPRAERPGLARYQTPAGSTLYILPLTGRGFGGPLELLAAYRADGRLYHAIMLANSETPGFGKKAEDPAYMKMFWDKKNIPTSKRELGKIGLDAVSGSTISFRAIARALRAGAEQVKTEF